MSIKTDKQVKEEKKYQVETPVKPQYNDDLNDKMNDCAIHSDGEEDSAKSKSKEESQENDAMKRVNAYCDETQGDEKNEDKMKIALSALRDQEQADRDAERKREKELAAVHINISDTQLIVDELELSPADAERKLREANGDIMQCLKKLLAE